MESKKRVPFTAWVLLGSVVVADIVTKHVAPLVGLRVVENHGVSLGLFNGFLMEHSLLVSFLLLLAVAGAIIIWKHWYVDFGFAGALFCGGALANVIDRFLVGYVRDWITIPPLGVYNNIADWAVFTGIILWIYQYFLKIKTS